MENKYILIGHLSYSTIWSTLPFVILIHLFLSHLSHWAICPIVPFVLFPIEPFVLLGRLFHWTIGSIGAFILFDRMPYLGICRTRIRSVVPFDHLCYSAICPIRPFIAFVICPILPYVIRPFVCFIHVLWWFVNRLLLSHARCVSSR